MLRNSLGPVHIDAPRGRVYRARPLREETLRELGVVSRVTGSARRLAHLAAVLQDAPRERREELRAAAEREGVSCDEAQESVRSRVIGIYRAIAVRQVVGVRIPERWLPPQYIATQRESQPDGPIFWEGQIRLVEGEAAGDDNTVASVMDVPFRDLETIAATLLAPHLETGRKAGTFCVAGA